MPESPKELPRTAANLHRRMQAIADPVGTLLVDGFHFLALFAIGATTVWSAVAAFFGMLAKGRAELSDILLLFIYLEIGAMVGIYFKTTKLPVRYLIYIAITALARVLIDIVGAEHRTGPNFLRLQEQFWFCLLLCWCCGLPLARTIRRTGPVTDLNRCGHHFARAHLRHGWKAGTITCGGVQARSACGVSFRKSWRIATRPKWRAHAAFLRDQTFRFIQTAFGSVKLSMAAVPCSRPRPESRSPPQGNRTSV